MNTAFRYDVHGKRFGQLIALAYSGEGKWRCKCDCGQESFVASFDLRYGRTKSCGCSQPFGGEIPKTPVERFEAKWTPVTESGCWLWLASTNHNGYGQFMFNKTMVRAHRFAYELYRGPIPVGLQIDHLCRVRCCVNPWHMEPVTNRENSLRNGSASAKNKERSLR